MKILIFGNSGFIGSIIENYLKSLNHSVIGISRNGLSDYNLDIRNEYEFNQIDFKPDIIINSVSKLPSSNSFDPKYVNSLCQINVIGALNIANWARKHNVQEIYNLSSLAIHNKPWNVGLQEDIQELTTGIHTPYAMSKIFQEKIMTESLKATDINVYHLRLSSVYGENMKKEGIIYNILGQIDNNSTIQITNGDQVSFDFIFANDIAKIIGRLLTIEKSHSVYNLASSQEIFLYELAELILKLKNKTMPINNVNSSKFKSRSVVDNTRVNTELGNFEYTLLENGLKQILSENK